MAERTVSVRLQAITSTFSRDMSAATSQIKSMRSELSTVGKLAGQQSQGFQELGTIGLAMGTGIAAGAAMAVKAAISYESAFAGVRKTINATESEFAALSDGIREMASRMPASAVEIAGVAEAAGQLGIQKSAVLGFSETMVQLGATTNLSADSAATAMARLANIMQTPQDEIDRMGAALVDLGNAGASTEADIVEMATRIASAGAQIGLTEGEVLGFANALSSVGIEAEAGGSAISRVMIDARNAVMDGGAELETFATTAGLSAAEFQRAFRDDAGGAIITFIEGLGRMEAAGLNSNTVLAELGFTDIRVGNALRAAAGAGDLFRESLELGNSAFEDNSALTDEYAKRMATTEAQLEILKNQVVEVAISFGEQMLPALNDIVDRLGDVVIGVGAFLDAVGPAGPVLATLASAVGVLGGGFLLLAPRIAATQAALATLRVQAPLVGSALGVLGKAGTIGAAAVGVSLLAAEVGKLGEAFGEWATGSAPADVQAMSVALLDLAETGSSGALATLRDEIGYTTDEIQDMIERAAQPGGVGESYLVQWFDDVDRGLANLVGSGNIEGASSALVALAEDLDIDVADITPYLNEYGRALENTEGQARLAAGAAKEADGGIAGVGAAAEGAEDALVDAEQALEDFGAALDAILGQAFSVTEAQDALTSAIFDLEDQIDAAKASGDGWQPTLEGNSRAAVENRDAVMDLVGGVADLVQAQADQGASSEEIQATLAEQKARLEDTLLVYGFTREEIATYLAVVDRIPAEVGTTVTVTGAEYAKGLIEGIAGAMARLQSSGIDVAVNAVGAMGVRPFAEGGMLPGDARIQGPGTLVQWAEPETGGEAFIPMSPAKRGRSTSILAQVAGEFGYGLVPMAVGGVINVNFGSSLAGAGKALASVGATPKGSATGLDPEFLRRFRAYSADVGPLSITSGFRSYAQQARLYAAYLNGTGNLAAPPGRSKHERGLAIDHGPRSTPSMRSTARKYRLHYPVPGEPWHVEPFAKGGIRGKRVGVRSFAVGGVLGGAVNDVRFRGGLMGAGIRGATAAGYSGDDVEQVARAWTDLAQAVDEATANMLLSQGLLASEFVDAAGLIKERTADTKRALEEQAEAAQRAYEQQVEINNNAFEMGRISLQDHLGNLDRRIARETAYTDEWMSLVRQREQVERDDYERRVEINNNLFELGRVSTEDHLANLDRRMAREVQFTDEWMALYQQREQVLEDMARREEERAERVAQNRAEFRDRVTTRQDNMFELGRLDADTYLKQLDRRLAGEVEYSSEWMSIYRQREQVLDGIAAAEEDRRRAAEEAHQAELDRQREQQEALRRRVDELAGWADVTQRVEVGWGNSAEALTSNIAQQVEMFVDWAEQLDAVKAMGVSDTVIDMLGLDDGPQALGQLKSLTGATREQLAALNDIAGVRQSQFTARAIAEGNVQGVPQVTMNFEAKVLIGNRDISDLVTVTLRDMNTGAAIAGRR